MIVQFPIEKRQADIWLHNRRTIGHESAWAYLRVQRDHYEALGVQWDPELFLSWLVNLGNKQG